MFHVTSNNSFCVPAKTGGLSACPASGGMCQFLSCWGTPSSGSVTHRIMVLSNKSKVVQDILPVVIRRASQNMLAKYTSSYLMIIYIYTDLEIKLELNSCPEHVFRQKKKL